MFNHILHPARRARCCRHHDRMRTISRAHQLQMFKRIYKMMRLHKWVLYWHIYTNKPLSMLFIFSFFFFFVWKNIWRNRMRRITQNSMSILVSIDFFLYLYLEFCFLRLFSF
jgi:hypothetical protein